MRLIPRWLRRKDRDPSRPMTMVEHLDELRRRILISIIAIVVAAIAGWFLYGPVFRVILGPYRHACQALPLDQRPPGIDSCSHVFVHGVVGPFLIRLKIALYVGLGIALPIVLFQLWRFITPGLTQKERRLTVPFGLSFEFPLVLIFLAWIRVVSSRRLRDWRRFAILFIVIFAAVITPSQDPFTLLAMSLPMVVFYETTIWITRLMKR